MRIIASPAIITLFTAISSSLPTYAADVTLYINGDIVASSCTVENNGMYNIDLGHNIPAGLTRPTLIPLGQNFTSR